MSFIIDLNVKRSWRLPLYSVISPGNDHLPEQCEGKEKEAIEAEICHSVEEMMDELSQPIETMLRNQDDSPYSQIPLPPVTDTLLYEYDFGDSWSIKITASYNCPDLIESGRITQTELDRANVKCRETYRPVLLARDGEMLTWARTVVGWKKGNKSDFNLL